MTLEEQAQEAFELFHKLAGMTGLKVYVVSRNVETDQECSRIGINTANSFSESVSLEVAVNNRITR